MLRNLRISLLVGFIGLTVSLVAAAEPTARVEPAAPSTRPASSTTRPAAIVVKDVDGNDCQPFNVAGGKAAVVFFMAHDCPISNSYSPEIGRIYTDYAKSGLRFCVVHPYSELPAAEAKKHAIEFKLPGTVIVNDSLAAVVGAKVTPEVAVVGPDGAVLYRGRIDDRWVGYAKARVEPNVRDLRDALDAIVAGTPVKVVETQAIGCPIEVK